LEWGEESEAGWAESGVGCVGRRLDPARRGLESAVSFPIGV